MAFLRKIEEAAAKKLRSIFLDAHKCAEYASADVEKLEKALEAAKIKAQEESQRAYQAAVEAADKAQKVANELMIEVKAAEERANYHNGQVDKQQ